MDALRQRILNLSRIQNLRLNTDGYNKLLDFLGPLPDPEQALTEIFRHLSENADGPITSTLVDGAIAKIQKLVRTELLENEGDFFEVQNASDVPHLSYDPAIKNFQFLLIFVLFDVSIHIFRITTAIPPLLGEVKAKREVFSLSH